MNATMYSKLISKYQNKYSKNNINNTNKKSTNKYKIKINIIIKNCYNYI